MRNTIKLVAIDLDGTLLNSRDQVSETNRRAIRDALAAGAVPLIASGRIREEAQFVLDTLPEIRYFVGMNGGLVEDLHAETVVQDLPLDRETARHIMARLDAAGFFYQIYARGGVYCHGHWLPRLREVGMSRHYLDMFADKIKEWTPDDWLRTPIYKMLAVVPTPERTRELRDLAAGHPGIEILCSLPSHGYHEILPSGIDKAQALAMLCERLDVRREELLAIGDSENDLELFRYAGKTAAVGNAAPVLRDAAGFVAPTNDCDGVAVALRHYLFI